MQSITTTVVVLALAALGLAACSPIDALNALSDAGASRTVNGIAYGSDPRQALDVYVPTRSEPPYPVVLFFFGGSWNSGSRADYRFVGDALASRGIMAIVADYRLYPAGSLPRLPGRLRERYRLDAGPSWNLRRRSQASVCHGAQCRRVQRRDAGARSTLACDGRRQPESVCGLHRPGGSYDFLPIDVPEVRPVFFYPHSPPDSQPIVYAGSHAPRTFLAAPKTDNLVNPERNTHQLAEKLSASGVAVTYKRYALVGHATLIGAMSPPLRWMAPVLDDVTAFIQADGKP